MVTGAGGGRAGTVAESPGNLVTWCS